MTRSVCALWALAVSLSADCGVPRTGPIIPVALEVAWRHRKILVAPSDAAFLQFEVGKEGGDANAAALLDDLAVHEGAYE